MVLARFPFREQVAGYLTKFLHCLFREQTYEHAYRGKAEWTSLLNGCRRRKQPSPKDKIEDGSTERSHEGQKKIEWQPTPPDLPITDVLRKRSNRVNQPSQTSGYRND